MTRIDADSFPQPVRNLHYRIRLVYLLVLVSGLVVAPTTEQVQDVYGCWLNWAHVTGGTSPWRLYLSPLDTFDHPLDCNYPPFILYLLTAVQSALNSFQITQFGAIAVTLVKLPGLISLLLCGWVCKRGLASVWGTGGAARAALLVLLCFPIWFNAAVWGQWDALLCLAILCAMVAAIRNKPGLTGAALGWAISIKFQAIVVYPAILIFASRTWKPIQVVKMLMAAAALWLLIAAPFFIAGAGRGLWNSYTGAVGHYPLLSVCANNFWMLMQTCTPAARQWTFPFGQNDDRPCIGDLTARQIGLGLFAIYTLMLLYLLVRRSNTRMFLHTAAMTAFAFYMLPTQMHERYILPACAIFAVSAAIEKMGFYLLLAASASMSQIAAFVYENQVALHSMTDPSKRFLQLISLVLSLINIILFGFGTVRAFLIPPDPPPMTGDVLICVRP
jgi:hypothetical protein